MAGSGHGMLRNPVEATDDVEIGLVGHRVLFPVGRIVRPLLAFDFEEDGADVGVRGSHGFPRGVDDATVGST